ncbi:MAG: hypothetical protein K0R38_7119 [Polyangiaceae bacterium]|nr:hypothetical protein [Polyangiaceae bacterium]
MLSWAGMRAPFARSARRSGIFAALDLAGAIPRRKAERGSARGIDRLRATPDHTNVSMLIRWIRCRLHE